MSLDRSLTETAAIRVQFGAIFVSLELSRSTWLMTSLSPGRGETMSKRAIKAGNVAGLLARLADLQGKALARTGARHPIVVQEAELDGFWLHRALEREGCESHVVDPASIAAPRRRRRPKTDGPAPAAPSPVALLMRVKGIGPEFAAVLWTEGLLPLFRQPSAGGRLRRPRADAVAQRSDRPRAGGVEGRQSAGSRKTMLQVAWLWLIHQPQSALARWYHQRLPGMTGKAARKRLIVALARKLFIALWKFTSAGVVIEGAAMKASA